MREDAETMQDTSSASQAATFDQIINLVSEIVVIKARLQQLMDTLVEETRGHKNMQNDFQSVSALMDSCQQELRSLGVSSGSVNTKNIDKTMGNISEVFGGLYKRFSDSSLHSLVLDLDEVTGRFGKVLGELQSVLMKMRTGTSSISIMQVLLVGLSDQVFAFPLDTVREIVKIGQDEIYSVDGNETIKLRDHAVGLVTLEGVIGVHIEKKEEKQSKRVVVISDGTREVGVIVDRLLGEEDIVSKQLSAHFDSVRGVSGASILGDGGVALILNVEDIINQAEKVCPRI